MVKIDDKSTLHVPAGSLFGENIQGLRNLRFHLGSMLNQRAAQIVFAHEKKCELDTSVPYFDISSSWLKNSFKNSIVFMKKARTLSFWYNWTSFYGNSISRPLLWAALAASVQIFIITLTDATLPPTNCVAGTNGWISSLCSNDIANVLLRNSIASIEPIINPAAVLIGKSFIPVKYILIALFQVAQGLFSITMIALTIIAIRRKFKFQS